MTAMVTSLYYTQKTPGSFPGLFVLVVILSCHTIISHLKYCTIFGTQWETQRTPFFKKCSFHQPQCFQCSQRVTLEIPMLSEQEPTRADKGEQGVIWVRVPCPPPSKALKFQRFEVFFVFRGNLLDTFLQIIRDATG